VSLATHDVDFLRALAKKALQRPHLERWVDRDGTAPVTSLSADDRKVGELARKPDVSKQSRLRSAAELPALGRTVKPSA
jgi:hypothetical protein